MTGAVAIILARGGSKGVPGKNTAALNGRPCIAYTIELAQRSKSVSVVAVSSDDAAALTVAREMGCVCVQRPAEFAHDTARVDDAARHALAELVEKGVVPGAASQPVVILYANCPIRPVDLIDRSVELLTQSGCDSVQSYAPVGKYHPWWTARLDASGQVSAWEGEVLNHGVFRRQDLPPAVIPDGGILAVTADALNLKRVKGGNAPGPHDFFGIDRRGVLNAEGAVIDIDTKYDLLVAEAMLRERSGAK